jgi:hypothetical protein
MPDFDKPGKSSPRPYAKLFGNCFWCLGGETIYLEYFHNLLTMKALRRFFDLKKTDRNASAALRERHPKYSIFSK